MSFPLAVLVESILGTEFISTALASKSEPALIPVSLEHISQSKLSATLITLILLAGMNGLIVLVVQGITQKLQAHSI